MKVYVAVDVQRDFMEKTGALYVPGSEEIVSKILKLNQEAEDREILILATGDDHPENDDEFGVFPPHCVEGTKGQEIIAIPEETNMYLVSRTSPDFAPDKFDEMPDMLVFPKVTYDIWDEKLGNRHFKTTVEKLGIEEAVVYGVATDYCVKAAVLGFLKAGVKVKVVEDAIAGVTPETTELAIKEMKDGGAEFILTE